MERYSEYKDSGVKWLGEIPSHWGVVRIKNVANMFGRIGFRGYTADDLVEEGAGAITLSPTNIIDGELDFTNCSYLSWNKYYESPEIMVKAGDVVLVKTASVGKCALVRSLPKETTVNPQFLVFKNIVANSAFFTYILQDYIQCFLDSEKNGSTIPTISQQIIGNFKIMLPPRTEQDSIVRYLDAATLKIDKAIAMQQKMIDLLNERKQIIIQNAVTKGLDENVEMKDSGVEWTEFFPNSWSIKKVKYIFEFISTKEVASNRTFNIALENIVAHSGNYIDTNSEYEAAGVSFRKNDILFGKLRPYLAKVHLCERAGIALGDIFVLRPLSGFDSSFLRYLLISERFIQYVDSSTYGAKMPRANWNFIGNIYVAYPTLDKQRDISKYLDKEMQRFDSAISNCQRQIALLQERKQIIINEVVTGKVKVS